MSGRQLALVYPLALLASFVASVLLAAPAARLAVRLGLVDRPGPRKLHREATPYLGGGAVTGGILLVGGLTAGASGQLAVILAGGLALALLGLVDDWRNLGAAPKILVEATAAVALWLAGVRAGLFGFGPLDLALTIAWVVAVTNAVNLLDNMDGLAAGTVAIAALVFFVIASGRGDYLVATFALAVAGASLGLLCYNFPPATIFLGDTGTLLLGFLLAAIALKLDLVGEPPLVRAAIPALALGVPLFDTTLVVIDRVRAGRPLHVGGMDHTSHRLAALCLSARGVVLTLYAAQLGCAALAFLLVHASQELVWPVVLAASGTFGAALFWLLALPPGLNPGCSREEQVASLKNT